MTRIVRLEEIDGDLVLRVPAELVAELRWAVGDETRVSGVGAGLQVDRVAPEDQLHVGRAVAARHRDALARLAR